MIKLKFAKIQYAKTEEEIPMNGLIRKMPRRFRDYYIKKKNPYTIKQVNVLETEGYEVCLPITIEEAKKNYIKNEMIVKNTLRDLNENEVGIIIPPQGILFPNGMRHADGKIIFAFFLNKTINRIFKRLGRDRKNAEFLIIDGGNFLTDLVLDCIYPEVNFLAIYTDRSQKLEEKGEEIYQDCGLNVQIFSNSKNAFLREADIIINCSMDLENYDYFFKKKAIYLDVIQNKAKIRRLMAKRADMLFVDGFQLKRENCYLSGEMMESIEYINNNSFRHFLTRQYHPSAQRALMDYFEEMNPVIAELYCDGRKLEGDRFFLTREPREKD